ncbi:hypothetical protein PI23P_09685 [Polaribacter irgensii 23-P]|uniref:Uncharacterized protein n=1 Tax=Polaribacter irgensii 23-P TaxID=313594 RepID=A4C0E6_9FLAO|nr:hypothetical protein PI23P_09685 [Polaribacter irgensii 23-P]
MFYKNEDIKHTKLPKFLIIFLPFKILKK